MAVFFSWWLMQAVVCISVSVAWGQGPRSCAGKCGKWSDECWCNDGCEHHGDCCADYRDVCPGTPGCPRTPNCGNYNCDEWIEYDPSKYSCDELVRDWSCNCTGCACGHPAPPAPSANVAKLMMFTEAEYPLARCLDGSMAGYYLRQGTRTDKYLMFFEGGGWCYDDNCESPSWNETLRQCRSRAKGRLGSSKSWPAIQDSYLKGMLSADAKANSVFHDWTLVYIPYCDGTSWSGNSVVDGVHFRGKAILDATISSLLASGIGKASTVVISGGSAGASAVFYHADKIAARLASSGLPKISTVLALPDAGFFLDLKDKDGIDCWPSQMRSLFDGASAYEALHSGCLQRFPEERWKCMFPEYYSDIVATPTFVLQSLYDSSEVSATLRLNCCVAHGDEAPRWCDHVPDCDRSSRQLLEGLRGQHIRAWAPLVKKPGNGVWAPACIDHTLTWKRWADDLWEVPSGSGHTIAAVVGRWLQGHSGGASANGSFVYEDPVSWPDNIPCAANDVASASTATRKSSRDWPLRVGELIL